MLSDLFQESDYVFFMTHSLDKKPKFAAHTQLPYKYETLPAYYSINPIDIMQNRNDRGVGTQRAGINVTAFRNFLFESDTLPLDVQLQLLKHLHTHVPLAQVTFSGGSSFHAIISVADTLPFRPHTADGLRGYTDAWKAINTELTALASEFLRRPLTNLFDQACKDPSRLSRTPGAIRPDNQVVQSELGGFGGYLSADDVLGLMSKHSDRPAYTRPTDFKPSSPDEKGELSFRTLNFINNWNRSVAHVWDWHSDFIFAVKDLQGQNYTFEEAQRMLSTITGHLDSNDLYQMRDVWGRNNFSIPFRPIKGRNNEPSF